MTTQHTPTYTPSKELAEQIESSRIMNERYLARLEAEYVVKYRNAQ
jgi:hypothetical protein